MFWIDTERRVQKSAEEFLSDLNRLTRVRKFNCEPNPYDMLLQLTAGMVRGLETWLLDADFSEGELARFGIKLERLKEEYPLESRAEFRSLEEVADCIERADWHLRLFTSGTTGLPKEVRHDYSSLARNVRRSERHRSDRWAFAYKMSHMAGVQVLLQALSNANETVYVFESAPELAVENIKKYRCTHISATPTFYRNLLRYLDDSLELTSITMGGEGFDEALSRKLHEIFPKAAIRNIYASTEIGSLLNAKGSGFEIPSKYAAQIKISSEGELLIHRSLLGEFPSDGEWYNTHDVVREEDGLIYFQARQSDLINVGGFKVNPSEVEREILNVEGVSDCAIKSRANSVMGNILCAEIVADGNRDEKKLRAEILNRLKSSLQSYKVPRLYKFVDSIERSRTGKKVR